MRSRRILTAFLFLTLFSTAAFAETYKIDKDHSSVSFKIRHVVSNVQGSFKDFDGTIQYDAAKPETWSAEGTIKVASIDTNVAQRDKHLQSKDFFNAEQYPDITFKTTKVTASGKDDAKVEGLLTMHGITKPVVLDVEIHGVGKDPWGNVSLGFTGTTKVNRKDFGIVWNQVLDQGQLMVGDDVTITLEIAANKQ